MNNTAMTSPNKSRLFYRIDQNKLTKYRQLRNSNQHPIIDQKTIGTQTTFNKEYNPSSTNSTHSLSDTSSSRE